MKYTLTKYGYTIYLGSYLTACHGTKAMIGLYEDPNEGVSINLTPTELRKLAETAILLATNLERERERVNND